MEQKNFSKLSSDTISALRFPLMVGIVFIHFGVLKGISVQGIKFASDLPYWLTCIQNLFSEVLPRIGVPLFFLMSGYLFFYSGLTKDSYKSKLKKRARTLLMPYIVWNALALLYKSAKMLPFLSFLFPNAYELQPDWSAQAILATFWNGRAGVFANPNAKIISNNIFPQDVPMWYVRDLMIMMIASPIFLYAIKKAGWCVVVVLGLAWYILKPYDLGHPCQLTTAAFFFSWGACYAIRGVDFAASMMKFRYALLIYIPIAVVDMFTQEWDYSCYIHNAGIIVGIFAAVSLTALLLENKKIKTTKFLASSSFFLFALHTLLMGDVAKVIVKFAYVNSPIYMAFLYFLVPTITILICLALYWLLRRFAPRLCALLTGGR